MTPYPLVFIFLYLISSSDSCMRMSPSEPGIPATPPCKKCAGNLITITTDGDGSKPFDSDTTDPNTSCLSRTLTCTGTSATIAINGPDGTTKTDPKDAAEITVVCNAAGNGWEYMGVTITQLECSFAADPEPPKPCEAMNDGSPNVDDTFPGQAGPPMITTDKSVTCDADHPDLYLIDNGNYVMMTNVMCDTTTGMWKATINGVPGPLSPTYAAPFSAACSKPALPCEAMNDGSANVDATFPGQAGPPMITENESVTCDADHPDLYLVMDNNNVMITNVMCDTTTGMWQATINGATGPLSPTYAAPFNVACSKPPLPCEAMNDGSANIDATFPGQAGPPMITENESVTCDADHPDLYLVMDNDNVMMTNVMCDTTTGMWQATINGVPGPLSPTYAAPFNVACSKPPLPCEAMNDGSANVDATFPGQAGPPMITENESVTCDADHPDLYLVMDNNNVMITNVMCDTTTGMWQATINGATGPLSPTYAAPFNVACSKPIPPCGTCSPDLIEILNAGAGSKPFDSADVTIEPATGCASMEFVCSGVNANIEINNADGTIADGDDGVPDEVAHFTVECNAAGDAWEFMNTAIVDVQCAAG